MLPAARRPELFAGLLLSGTGAHMSGHPDVDLILDGVANHWSPSIADRVVGRSYHRPPLPAHVQADLREDDVGGGRPDPGDLAEPFHRRCERGGLLLDPGLDATDDSLIQASSRSFSARFFSAVAALTRSTR